MFSTVAEDRSVTMARRVDVCRLSSRCCSTLLPKGAEMWLSTTCRVGSVAPETGHLAETKEHPIPEEPPHQKSRWRGDICSQPHEFRTTSGLNARHHGPIAARIRTLSENLRTRNDRGYPTDRHRRMQEGSPTGYSTSDRPVRFDALRRRVRKLAVRSVPVRLACKRVGVRAEHGYRRGLQRSSPADGRGPMGAGLLRHPDGSMSKDGRMGTSGR